MEITEQRITVSFMDASVVELELARRILFLCGFSSRREDGDLLVFVPERRKSFYAGSWEHPAGSHLGRLTVNEGHFSDCLKSDLSVGLNDPWSELVAADELLGTLVRRFEPACPIEESRFGFSRGVRRHLREQFITALVRGDQSKHPLIRFER